MSDNISPDVVILTRRELRDRLDAEYQRGVSRGKFETYSKDERAARNCANWNAGFCQTCGFQHQDCQVSADFKCPHWRPKP